MQHTTTFTIHINKSGPSQRHSAESTGSYQTEPYKPSPAAMGQDVETGAFLGKKGPKEETQPHSLLLSYPPATTGENNSPLVFSLPIKTHPFKDPHEAKGLREQADVNQETVYFLRGKRTAINQAEGGIGKRHCKQQEGLEKKRGPDRPTYPGQHPPLTTCHPKCRGFAGHLPMWPARPRCIQSQRSSGPAPACHLTMGLGAWQLLGSSPEQLGCPALEASSSKAGCCLQPALL